MFSEGRDVNEGWEASFYRSLAEADGLLLVGGGPSTLIAGHVGLALEKPVLPITYFNGGAAKLHSHIEHAPNAPTMDELQAVLGWSTTSARTIVASLVRRHALRAASRAAAENHA